MIMRTIFKKEVQDPKAVFRIAMLFLAISAAWPRLIPLAGSLGTDIVDGVKGLLLGIAIGLIIWAGRLGAFRKPGRLN
jgi:hypothetical protein